MFNRIKLLILLLVCMVLTFTGCSKKNTTDEQKEDISVTPTVSPVAENEEDDPFKLPFEDGTSIELPSVDGVEWDEDEQLPSENESIQEFQKPFDDGNNDLPSVPGAEWDDDISEDVVAPTPSPTAAPTTVPTPTPTVTPTQVPESNGDNDSNDNVPPGISEPEQISPTTTPAPTPEVTEETVPGNNELPGADDIGWD